MRKVCTSCGVEKDLDLFSKAGTCVDGHRSYCKACQKIRKDRWRLAHKEHHNAKGRAWVAANPDKRKEVANKCSAKRVASGKSKATHKGWREKNLERSRQMVRDRRAKVKQATPPWVDTKEIRGFYRAAQALGMTVDHIVPISSPSVSGLHVVWNLQLLTRKENFSKGNNFERDIL